MCSDSPTRGFPYTNSWLPLTWSGPGLSALIHPAGPRPCVCVSVCVGQCVRAHLSGNDSPLKGDLWWARASKISSRCLQSGAQDRVIALPLALAHTCPLMRLQPCHGENTWVCGLAEGDSKWTCPYSIPACSLQNSHFGTGYIQRNRNWELLDWAFKASNTNGGKHRTHLISLA